MELRYLSSAFYLKYKNCPEIMSKGETRPYIILIIEIENFIQSSSDCLEKKFLHFARFYHKI